MSEEQSLFKTVYGELSATVFRASSSDEIWKSSAYKDISNLSNPIFRELCGHLYDEWMRRKRIGTSNADTEPRTEGSYDVDIQEQKDLYTHQFASLSSAHFSIVASALLHELECRYPELKYQDLLEAPPAQLFEGGSGAIGGKATMKQSSDDWISSWQANCKNLTTFLAFTTPMSISSKSECLAMTRAVAIYPHLIAYIFVHLTMYSSNLQPLTKLWEMGAGCRHWDDHTCLLKYHTVLECLWNLLQENDRDLSIPGCNLRHLLALDMDILRNKVENVLQDKKSKEQLLELCASDPVPLSNLLQTLLDAQNETADFKRLVVRMLARIAKKSGCYPDSLVLQGIQTKGTRPVAGGGFADVWKGSMPNGNEVVALKAFRVYTQSVRRKILQRFSHEAVIWRQLRHPNILPFYGVHAGGDESGGDEFGELSLVSPWMDTGNILNYVDANPQADRISLLADVTQGLKYLHLFEPTVVHGDIKAANVLITPSLNACLADFGLASLRDSQESTWDTTTEKAAGTLRWQAPELLLGDENGETVLPNRCSDIYSFGCLCIEVFTGKAPFAEILRDTVVVMSIMQKRTPKRPSDDLSEIGLDESMWNMMEQCWQSEPTHRPTIVQVEEYFNGRNGDGRRPPVVRDDLPAGVRSTLGQYGFSDAYLDEVSNREDCSASVDPVARVPETRDISNPDSRIQSANSIIHDIALTDLTTLRRLYADGTISPSVSLYSAVESYSNRISLFMGDITRLQVDVIVTNHFLVDRKAIFVGYNTLDSVIHRRAGPRLLEEYQKLGYCDVGKAKITKGYDLPSGYVIHTNGPCYDLSRTAVSSMHLSSCYRESFNLAAEHSLKTIAFPAISTGLKEFPKEEAAKIALSETRRFLDSDKGAMLNLVVFAVFDEENWDAYCELLPRYFPHERRPPKHAGRAPQ